MLRAILSFVFAAFLFLSITPALANESAEAACVEQSSADVVAHLTSASTSQVNCSSDYDCGYNNICDYGSCRPAQCYNDNQCMPWEACERGRCERDAWATSCRTDADCFGARYCRGGYCKRW